ncbi:hypothetical protein Psuf_038200 [Phytohabitans suffuscus]|uniref:DUF1996 domain-containing protein n=1 Tax=Phytohabitans suffuscus TaxID=624315 RepID=A0A6F8YKA3_9ACTN|nr:hypothetical protein Psuf_038200 [Phytohabitans suffuscus]
MRGIRGAGPLRLSGAAERRPPSRRRIVRRRTAVLGTLAVAALVAAVPVLAESDGGGASAHTRTADRHEPPERHTPHQTDASSRPAPTATPSQEACPSNGAHAMHTGCAASSSPATSGKPGAPAPGEYIRLPKPVPPLPAPAGKPPFAQYREMHANCKVTKRANDDPIVFPGKPGASHNHTFVGNTVIDAYSTPESLVRTGVSSCEDKGDTASYWFPTLLRGGQPVEVSTVTFYYKSGVKDYRTVRPFPPGFRLLVGDMRTPNAAAFGGEWSCGRGASQEIPASCPSGNVLVVRYKAPSCWDGVHLDTPDHKSHMTYPVDGLCPSSHPVALPMLQSKIAYKLSGAARTDCRTPPAPATPSTTTS